MPLYACRHEWCEDYCARGSATPIPSQAKTDSAAASSSSAVLTTTTEKLRGDYNGCRRQLPPLLLCTASTGTGKSVLIPLYALDAHWAVLERRLVRTIDAYDNATEAAAGTAAARDDSHFAEAEAANTAFQPFPLDSQENFIREFTACSRLRIVVSQPTRVACAELAAYVSALLDAGRTCVGASGSAAAAPKGAALDGESRSENEQRVLSRQLVGKRVGFAVGGESRFCSESELLFATPGYALNALRDSHPQSSPSSLSLSPTTLVVDEAHCRDVETDALLAWMKLSRECRQGADASAPFPVLRQYYVVSATMNLQAMDTYLCRGLQNGNRSGCNVQPEPREGLTRGLTHRLTDSDALPEDAKGTDCVSADAPLLLLSPAQRHHVRRWWQREQSHSAGGRIDSADVDSAVARAVATDRRVRAAVLQLVEAAECYGECDDGDREEHLPTGNAASSVNGSPAGSATDHRVAGLLASGAKDFTATTAAAPSRVSPPRPVSALRGADGAAIVIAMKPYRVERYFVDDLDPVKGCFASSRVLFDEAARRAATAATSAAAPRTPSNAPQGVASGRGREDRQPKQQDTAVLSASAVGAAQRSTRGFPICLTDDGAALRRRLVDLHGTRAASYVMLNIHTRALVELILQLLQAARYRWIDGAAMPSTSAAPPRSQRCEQSHHEDGTTPDRTPTALAAANPRAVEAPITILVFVAGIGELHQIMSALERLCDTVQPSSLAAGSQSTSMTDSSAPATPVLRHGSEVFSVGLLHSTAVGSPQEQLMATEHSGAPLRLLLSTNVAESSLTIANTRIVVDTCLERSTRTDNVTGATQVLTSFVSPSGLRQRCGRVGRTGDGIVIHLAPRRFVLPKAFLRPLATTQVALPPPLTVNTSDPPPATLTFEALPDGIVTVLLRMKFLFSKVGNAVAALPSPPNAAAVRLALQQLSDMDLLLLPEAATPQEATRDLADAVAHTPFNDADALHSCDGALLPLLDGSTFTPKGHFVASLPLPYEHATLVYHGLQFRCVEDALIVACAMAVPSLFSTPRVSSYSTIQAGARRSTNSDYALQKWDADRRAALSPLEQFYRQLWVQRHFAGFAVRRMVRPATCPSDGSEATDSRRSIDSSSASDTDRHAPTTAAATMEERQAGQLSEPLMLRALLRQWYAFSNVEACIQFQNTHGLNRSAMRQVDNMVAQTCGRLTRILLQLSAASVDTAGAAVGPAARRFVVEDAEAEVDFSAYVCQTDATSSCSVVGPSATNALWRGSSGNGSAIGLIPFLQDWPAEAQTQLLRSLRRLQRVAVSRVQLCHTRQRQRYGLPQWYDSEEWRIRLWGRPYLRYHPDNHSASRTGGRGAGKMGQSFREEERAAREAVRRHPCFTYWADGLPALRPPYPSLYKQQCLKPAAANGVITPSSLSVPPPLSKQATQSKVPTYRPPAPPPPIPPVVFVMGRTEDRLCAAFVAAFGQRTLRGEDGGHRFHHRRLLRNMQALENDEEHVCTFHIDVQQQEMESLSGSGSGTSNMPGVLRGGSSAQQGGRSAEGPPTCAAPLCPRPNSYDLLCTLGVTSKSVEQALSPYLRGAGLQQLELFQSNRLAVAARFASDGFTGLFDSLSPTPSVTLPASADPGNNAEEEGGNRDAGGVDAASMQRTHAVRDGQHTTVGGARRAEAESRVTTSEAAPTSTRPVSSDGTHGPPAEDLLKAAVLPSSLRCTDMVRPPPVAASPDRGTSTQRSHPYVQLAPFGVSLLAAATAGTGSGGGISGLGGLQRISLAGAATSALNSPTAAAPPSSSLAAAPTSPSASLAPQVGSAAGERCNVFFSEVPLSSSAATARLIRGGVATATVATTTCVAWSGNLGMGDRSVTRAAAEALGLADLFPTAPPPSKNASPLDSRGTHTRLNSGDNAAAAPAPSPVSTISQLSDGTATPSALTVSVVPPIYITRSITWRAPLPALVPSTSSMAHAAPSGSASAAQSPVHYCVLCNHLCSNQGALDQHYLSVSHLEHLFHAIQLGLRREHLAVLYGWAPRVASDPQCSGTNETHTRDHAGFSKSEGRTGTLHPASSAAASLPLASLLSLQSSTHLPLTQHVYPCVIDAQSFLNCLQWSNRESPASSSSLSSSHEQKASSAHKAKGRTTGVDRATPLAVAGTLVALQSVTDILPPPHLRQPIQPNPCRGSAGVEAAPPSSSVGAETLSAHHVWVLNLSSSGEVGPAASATTHPPMSALLVVAGYLAAASPQARAALLLNSTHTYLHAVMLHGWGVWRLPTPLPMEGYMGLLEQIGRGGGWPGVLVPIANDPLHSRQHGGREESSAAVHDPSDGLHWCLPEAACALTTDEHRGGLSASVGTRDCDAIVEATLLLVLHEYLQARRNMVTLADYVERVMRKLQLSPFVGPGARAAQGTGPSPAAVTAAEILATYLKRVRHGQTIQTLLRDLGCIFATPPRALATLLQPTSWSTFTENAEGSCSGAQGGQRDVGRRRGASVSPAEALSKRLSYRALSAEGAAVEMMFTVPPALPSRLPSVTFAAKLRQFYVDRHAHRWVPQSQAPARPTRTGSAAAATARAGAEQLTKNKSLKRHAQALQARDSAGRLRSPRKVYNVTDVADNGVDPPQF
uniref:Helicase C-terminal domain-containing protein n=1 Tax=Leishmania guyanensis TaxID=5670 RepID=A0A1E1IRB7_LEIGU|nr:hypothetical protein, conserved [Leishmania guyanensis]